MNASVSSFVPKNRLKEVNQAIEAIDEVIKSVQGPHKVHADKVSAPKIIEKLRKMKEDKMKERKELLSSSLWRNSNGGSRKKMNRRTCRRQRRSRRN
jgi:hypothetical protein